MSAVVPASAPQEGTAAAQAGRERFTAFLVDEGSEQVTRQAMTQLSLPFSSVIRGNVAKAITHLKNHRSPIGLMVDISGVEFPLAQVAQLAEVCEPGVSVVIVGDRNDVGLYRDLLNLGVSDYIVKPLAVSFVQTAINNILGTGQAASRSAPISQKLGQAIAILGARGGVGTTTVATNLAWHLANKENRRVALVDLDLFFGGCALMLDAKPGSGLREALENPKRLDELFLDRAMLRCGERLHLLAAEEPLDAAVRPAPDALAPLFTLLRKQFHYVVIDVPRRGTGFIYDTMKLSSTNVFVLDQTAQAVRDVLRLKQFLVFPDTNQTNLMVLNRVGEGGKTDITVKDLSETLGMNVQVTIPYQPKHVVSGGNAGIPVTSQRGPVSNAIANLAKNLSGQALVAKKPWWRMF